MANIIDIPDVNLASDRFDEPTLRNKLLQWVDESEQSDPERLWRWESIDDYNFYAGHQDTREVIRKLDEQHRPDSTFNKIRAKVDIVTGLAAQSNRVPYIFSVTNEDEALTEIMNGAFKHFRRLARIKRLENECFEHAVKTGRSFLYFYLSGSNPFQPQIKAKRIAGRDVLLDPLVQEYDLSDCRYVMIDKWFFAEDILAIWPQMDLSQIRTLANTKTETPRYFDMVTNKYRITECWYRVWDKIVWFRNPLKGNKIDSCLPAEFKVFTEQLAKGIPGQNGETIKIDPSQIQSAERLRKTVRYAIFSNMLVLEEGPSPFKFRSNDDDYFPIVLYGAFKDEWVNEWFGLIRGMRDPQRMQNTVKRQFIHLLQTAQKNILVHEVGAIANEDEYQDHSSEPNFRLQITPNHWDKWKFTEAPQIPAAYNQLDATSEQDMKDVSGVQDPMLGIQTSSREPGVTAKLRQDTSIAVLHTLYDNFRESRIQGGRILLGMIQQFMTEETMIRIEGPTGARNEAINQQVNPNAPKINDVSAGEYDLVVDEAADNITMRMGIAGMLNDFAQNNPGTIPPEMIMEYMDMPLSARQQVIAYRQQQQELQMRQLAAQMESKEGIAHERTMGKLAETHIKGKQKSEARPHRGGK